MTGRARERERERERGRGGGEKAKSTPRTRSRCDVQLPNRGSADKGRFSSVSGRLHLRAGHSRSYSCNCSLSCDRQVLFAPRLAPKAVELFTSDVYIWPYVKKERKRERERRFRAAFIETRFLSRSRVNLINGPLIRVRRRAGAAPLSLKSKRCCINPISNPVSAIRQRAAR